MECQQMIEIRDLNYHYPDGTSALCAINLNISKGETWGLIGSNGAGKSTLLHHLNGILIGCGEIFINGIKVDSQSLKRVRGLVGLVFQDPDNQLFMPTVFEDVAFGPANMGLSAKDIEEAVDSALDKVDMAYAKTRSSHHLSFGERKRVSIATVLSMNPLILALDEPTSSLDPQHRRKLINYLNSIELTKVIATHDLSLVREACTNAALMDNGKIIAAGSVDCILGDHDLLSKYGFEWN